MSLFLSYFERVTLNSQAHSVFSTHWNSYTSYEFGTTFLPQSNIQSSGKLRVYDAAELINSISPKQNSTDTLLGLQDVEFSFFSFAKNSEASLKYNNVYPDESELSVFVEIQNNEKASVFFKFGNQIAKQINAMAEGSDQRAEVIVGKKFDLSIEYIKQSLKSKTLEQNVLAFSMETMGFELTTISIVNFEKVINDALSEIVDVDGVLFDAGYIRDENPKAWAHGDIEKRAFKGIFSDTEILKIYYGNWLRDYSSVITGLTVGFDFDDRETLKKLSPKPEAVDNYEDGFSSKPSQKTWVKVIELLAANEFVYKQPGNSSHNIVAHLKKLSKDYDAPTKDIVGLYRPEEHIDNPKALIDESALSDSSLDAPVRYTYSKIKSNGSPIENEVKLYVGESPESLKITSNMKKYIKNTVDHQRPSSLRFVDEQLRLAQKKGRNKTGFRHFGAALHVIEDFYAHSNFVEVALIKLGYTKVYPWVDSYSNGTAIPSSNVDACKIPIVTGYFGQLDVIASLAPKIAKEFFPTSFQDYKGLKPGDRTLMDELILLVLDDYIGKENGMKESDKFTFLGFGFKEMKKNYLYYLEVLDAIRKVEQTPIVGNVITFYKKTLNAISQTISFLPNFVISLLLNSLYDAIQSKQTYSGAVGTDPSHTQLAKDHADHHFNDLAGYMAYLVVNRIGKEMVKCWKGDKNASVESIINLVDQRYFIHPCDVDWIDEHIEKWAKDNPNKVKRGESKTIYEHGEKEFNKFKKAIDDKIKQYS